jgi:hypothetical protein
MYCFPPVPRHHIQQGSSGIPGGLFSPSDGFFNSGFDEEGQTKSCVQALAVRIIEELNLHCKLFNIVCEAKLDRFFMKTFKEKLFTA